MADPTNSSTGGCLKPLPAFGLDEDGPVIEGLDEGVLDGDVVLEGSADGRIAAQLLQRFLGSWFACVTGLDGALVRPRWQPEPANLPPAGTTWAAFGVTDSPALGQAAVVHIGESETDGDGLDELQTHEEMTVLVSFYGPNADAYARRLRDGAQVSQNRERLFRAGMGLIETPTGPLTVPSMEKGRWLYRCDVTVRIRRGITRQYDVQNIAAAEVGLHVGDAVAGGTIDTEITITE